MRVNEGAVEEAVAEAVKESERTGKRWDKSKVGREWLRLGREVWFEERKAAL